jgi:carbon storage regulator
MAHLVRPAEKRGVDWAGAGNASTWAGLTTPLKEEALMLILTRKPGESVRIAGGIQVTVVSVEGHRVRLGFAAPPEVRIDREEVHARVRQPAEVAPPVVGAEAEA